MNELVDALMQPDAWPFPVDKVEHLETHISHLFLVGDLVYKVKKPLDLGFLDFSTLEKRRFFCEEEIRLNSRMAPGIYLEAVPITRDESGFHVEGEGEAVEFAVKMRRFDQQGLLDRHPLDGGIVDAMAERVAAFHASLPPAPPDSEYGLPEKVWFPMGQNFDQIRELGLFPQLEPRLSALAEKAREAWRKREPLLARRKQEGFIRECHGDMHLGNIALVEGEVIIFDGIEFNPALSWIDTANDIAFLLMDLEKRGHENFAWRFLNRYLELTGDYEAVALLDLYKSYRAMVRAKVAAIRLAQEGGASEALEQEFMGYLDYAERCLASDRKPRLCITFGLSGSGKSHFCLEMRERLGMIHLRSDLERKRLFGLAPEASSRSALAEGIYTPEANERTYRRLEELATGLLEAGYPVVVDATFLNVRWRRQFAELAESAGANWCILDFLAPEHLLRERVAQRAQKGEDPSEAGLEVLERQLARYTPLEPAERSHAIPVTPETVDDREKMKMLLVFDV